MGVRKLQQRESIDHWTDLWFTDSKKTGYVAITDFEKQFFYGINDIDKIINQTRGKTKQYISINAFDVDWQEKDFSRAGTNLKQIRNIAIDIDQYKLDMTTDEAIDSIHALVMDDIIPEPNLILTSRGLQLFYSIDGGASPQMAWLAGYITEQLISKLSHIGADSNAKDMSRVMRVPDSVNERNGAIVEPEIWNKGAYTLQELQAYCKPLERFEYKGKKAKVIPFKMDSKLELFYRTNYARRDDLVKLVELRNGDMTGCRNVFLYMYTFHQSLNLNTKKEVVADALRVMGGIYSRDPKAERMTKKWMENTIKSAYEDAREFFEYYKANGHRIVFKDNDGIKKPYKTSNVIDKLAITEDEQMHMRSLRNAEIAKKQHADYMRNQRRSNGAVSRDKYEQQRQEHSNSRLQTLKELLEKGYKQKQIAEAMSVSVPYVKKLKKKLQTI